MKLKAMLILFFVTGLLGGVPGSLVEIKTTYWDVFTLDVSIYIEDIASYKRKDKAWVVTESGDYVLKTKFLYEINGNPVTHLGVKMARSYGSVITKEYPHLSLYEESTQFYQDNLGLRTNSFCGILVHSKPHFINCETYPAFKVLRESNKKLRVVYHYNSIKTVEPAE